MTQLSDLEFLKLSKGQRFGYKLGRFFTGIPKAILGFFLKIWGVIKKGGAAVGTEIADIVNTFIHGDWKTKLSFFVMGFGNIARGQILRGLLFLLFEIVFIGFMILSGGYWLSMLPSLGKVGPSEEYNGIMDADTTNYHDNYFQIPPSLVMGKSESQLVPQSAPITVQPFFTSSDRVKRAAILL